MSKGLSREVVAEAALRLIDEKGFEAFSLAALAGSLGVKTASLYNHVSGLDELLSDVGRMAADRMNAAAEQEMRGKSRKDALLSLAFSLWEYAKQHPGLYHLMVRGTMNGEYEGVRPEAIRVLEPITAALGEYDITEKQRVHWHRLIRSIGYGFILHETAGAFSCSEVDTTETFRMAVELIHRELCALEDKNRSERKEEDGI